jgi:hypothetical protein
MNFNNKTLFIIPLDVDIGKYMIQIYPNDKVSEVEKNLDAKDYQYVSCKLNQCKDETMLKSITDAIILKIKSTYNNEDIL